VANLAWERQAEHGESASAYAHFCYFRDLGPSRSRDAAFRAFLADQGREVAGTEQAPGRWTRECSRWGWVERAGTWDAHVARRQVGATVCRVVTLVNAYAARVLEAMEDAEGPAGWEQITAAIDALCRWLPPDSSDRLPRGDEPWQPPQANGSPALEPPRPGDTDHDPRNDRPGDRPPPE
jgi:hypothetical protein